MSRKLVYYLIMLFVVLPGCNKPVEGSGHGGISPEKRDMYGYLGQSGFGDAYTALEQQSSIFGEGLDPAVYESRALMTGGSIANSRYSSMLLSEAKRLPKNSKVRILLLQEARKRAELSITNAYLWIESERLEYGRARINEYGILLNSIDEEISR